MSSSIHSLLTTQTQQNILEAISMVERGERKKAIQWIESGFRLAASLPSLAADLPYYADAVIRLELTSLVTHPELQTCITDLQKKQQQLNYPEALVSRFPNISSIPESPKESYAHILDAFQLAQQGQNPEEARRLVSLALSNFRKLHDLEGETEALHFSGRIEHELDNLDQAMSWYDQEMKLAHTTGNQGAIARAMHERARIFQHRDYDFIKAEEGYRHALNYYVSQGDEANLQAAIDGLASLAQDALSNDEFYLPLLEKEGAPIGSPAQYLHIRGVAIKAELWGEYDYYLQLLVRWAEQELERDTALARYIIREMAKIADFHRDLKFIREEGRLLTLLFEKERASRSQN